MVKWYSTSRLALVAVLALVMGARTTQALAADEHAVHANDATAAVEAAVPSHDGHGAVHAEGHKTYGLLPDADDDQTWYQAIWVLVIFLIMLAVLYPTAWKGVLAGLKAREDRIRKDIADAEAARVRADATLREYNTQLAGAESRIREMLAKATADGETIATNIRARAQQEAEETKEKAQRDIEAARDQAISQLHNETVLLATTIAEKIIHRNLNADDQRDLLSRSLEQLQGINRN